MRIMPFNATLESASNKVRAALSASGQRELARRLAGLSFVGVPARPLAEGVGEAFERAWFEQSSVAILYPIRTYELRSMHVRIRTFVLDRTETRVNVTDEHGKQRQLVLDRVRLG
jgi:hypothetical protein